MRRFVKRKNLSGVIEIIFWIIVVLVALAFLPLFAIGAFLFALLGGL